MPLISVILPCYNVEKLIDRCLTSIVEQTIGVTQLEIICVDDCSTDHTWDKLLAWEERYPELFMVVKSDENGRQGKARNIGMQYATAQWLGFIDSDDWIEPDYFEILYQYARDSEYDMVCCGHERDFSAELTFFEKEKRRTEKEDVIVSVFDDEKRREIIKMPPLGYSAWAKLIRKDFLLDHELLFPEYITYEDAAWGSLFHLYVKNAYIVKEKLYHYYVNADSTVLTTNSNHHLDCILSQDMLWEEWKKRGFLEKYPKELEVEHIFSGYLAGLKACIFRYEKPDYNYYLLLRHLSYQKVPNFEKNDYLKGDKFPELYKVMLQSLKAPLSRPQFMEFASYVKRIGL